MKRFVLLLLCGLAWPTMAALRAQDFTVGEIVSCVAADSPAQLPRIRGEWRPAPPTEALAGTEPEIVFLQLLVRPDGEFDHCVRGTNPVLNKSAGKSLRDLKLAPAESGGAPVDAYVWLPLIFNPAAAAETAREAVPRVLGAAPFLVPAELFAELKLGETAKAPRCATVEIDASGVLQGVALESPAAVRLQPFVERALRQWRFAPARAAGKPVAGRLTLRVSFFSERVLVRPKPSDMRSDVAPKPIKQVAPEYPRTLLKQRMAGCVLVRFVVDVQGRVQNPEVVSSDHPAFDRPALEAVSAWRFSPALRGGKPVPMDLQLPILFTPRPR